MVSLANITRTTLASLVRGTVVGGWLALTRLEILIVAIVAFTLY